MIKNVRSTLNSSAIVGIFFRKTQNKINAGKFSNSNDSKMENSYTKMSVNRREVKRRKNTDAMKKEIEEWGVVNRLDFISAPVISRPFPYTSLRFYCSC